MRFALVLMVVLAGTTMTSGKPLILTKKFLRYVLPTITAKVAGLSGLSGLTGLTGLTGISGTSGGKNKGVGSVYLPNRLYSFLFPKDSLNPPASVIYHSLEDFDCYRDPHAVPLPPPPPVQLPVPHDITVAHQTLTQYGPVPVDPNGPVYIAPPQGAPLQGPPLQGAPLPGPGPTVSVSTYP